MAQIDRYGGKEPAGMNGKPVSKVVLQVKIVLFVRERGWSRVLTV
jgi:hypothetical protein